MDDISLSQTMGKGHNSISQSKGPGHLSTSSSTIPHLIPPNSDTLSISVMASLIILNIGNEEG